MPAQWEIIGGADKGGIIVREGFEVASPLLKDRLATGAKVEELKLDQGRLHYRKLTGAGPDEGWISIAIPGKELARRLPDAAEGDAWGEANDLSAWMVPNSEPPAEDPPEWCGLKLPKPRGKFVAEGTGRAKLEPWVPKLAELPPKLQNSFPWKELLKNKSTDVFGKQVGEAMAAGPKGYHYGMEFPYTLQMIQDMGVDWLTRALHKAGTLPEDNRVVSMKAKEFVGGGACLKATIECQYEKPSEDLHEKLFCKYPFPVTAEGFMNYWNWACVMNNDGPEIDFARILSAGAPMRCPKYYYGDICPLSGLSLLITECLAFPADEDADFGPQELEPIPEKSVDYLLDDPFAYYDAIVRNLAKLAAWGWNGKLGKDVLTTFPDPEISSMLAMGVKMKIPKFLHFARSVAPQIFPPNYADEQLEKSLYDTLLDIERCQTEIYAFMYSNKDLIGLTHQNANIDNAFFWRDESGNVESGFIDWGRFRQENYASGLMNGFTCCDLPEFLHARDRDLIQGFCDEFAKHHKPGIVTFEKLWEHYMVQWCVQSLFLCNLADTGIYPSWELTQPAGWANIKDYKDPRVFRMPNCNRGWVAMLRQWAAAWKYKDIPSWWAQWRKKNCKTPTPAEKAAQDAAKKAAKAKQKAS